MSQRFSPGQEVGGFLIEQVLGASEGGTTHLARDPRSEHQVLLKTVALAADQEDSYPRLRHYIRQASEVQHKNLARVYGLGREGEHPFVVMEYLQGQTLAEYLKHRRERKEAFSPRAAYNTIAHLCQGLQALHEKTCHGALTPQNVYVTKNGRFKLTNLGYARFTAELLVKKGAGPYADSPFMPPEVRDNPLATSSSADLYAVAMMTAELLSPQPITFGGSISPREQALRVAAHFGEAMVRLLEQALSDDPDQRPETIGQLRDMLKAVCEAIPEQEVQASPSVAPPVAHDLEEESGFYKINIPVADAGEPAPLPTLATLLPPSALGKTGEAPKLAPPAPAASAPEDEVEVFQGARPRQRPRQRPRLRRRRPPRRTPSPRRPRRWGARGRCRPSRARFR